MAGHSRHVCGVRIVPGIFPLVPVALIRIPLRWLRGAMHVHRAEILAAAEHFLTPVTMGVEMPMSPTIRPGDPDIRAAVDEHDVVDGSRRDIDVVGFRQDDFCGNWPYDDRARRGRGDHRDDGPRGVYNRLSSNLSLSGCHAPGQT